MTRFQRLFSPLRFFAIFPYHTGIAGLISKDNPALAASSFDAIFFS